ncbi:endonuclease/exonuclease/phosphatase family protein [Sediminibacterium ginsengisoli]|uniref:Endonuclease/Exonuclease/phosphatase family protein n=1 Tax=Sediminibacterium ginsengisoli TaxID=413434 RepID=A0A1T4KMG3_9BACT|nr:endonuclease/exonuclease/phosphatase [Sediminibacterium ginsengisoli]SJZ43568.1 Endonuclease/Exonuclease/phosphatase family protein [Sediminibacterium ginsengisoli]
MVRISFLYWLLSVPVFMCAQANRFKVRVIAFYNLENLYDTTDNPVVNDDDFTPAGNKRYTSRVYSDKLEKLASVISRIGTESSEAGAVIIGVAEIENDTVLLDLCNQPLLRQRQYRFVHYDSKDIRGVDVGLLYQPAYFIPIESEPLFVPLPGKSKSAAYTRDILYVRGLLDGEEVHIYVNHWPSRRGGEERTSIAREAAAAVCRSHIERICLADTAAKIIVMGDLNDDPYNSSITKTLKARGKRSDLRAGDLFNPWDSLYRKGIGTLAHHDNWGLFDQIILSQSWLNAPEGFFYYRNHIFMRPYMMENAGRYKGYPMRTWDGDNYRGGYSDHFPTYITLLKPSGKGSVP